MILFVLQDGISAIYDALVYNPVVRQLKTETVVDTFPGPGPSRLHSRTLSYKWSHEWSRD
jgi:hypothetical protein